MLTTEQVAKKLGVTRGRVVAMLQSGRLKGTKFANVWMIDPKDLSAVKDRKPGRPTKVKL